MTFELLFVISLFGLYIYDSTLGCHSNDVFISFGLGKHPKYRQASMYLRIGKNFLNWPNLFTPHRLLFRCQWQLLPLKSMQLEHEYADIQKLKQTLRPVQWVTTLLFGLTLIALPVIVLLKFNILILAIIIVIIYSLNLCNTAYLLLKRKYLNLSNKQLLNIVFDSLLCPVFALNTVAKISLNHSISSDATLLAQRILSQQGFKQFKLDLNHTIEQLKQQHETQSADFQRLDQRQSALKQQI